MIGNEVTSVASGRTAARSDRLRDGLLAAFVFVFALLPRALGLGRFVTWDEPVWAYRTLRFWQAMLDGRPADTVVAAHPGVLTVWLGGLGVGLRRIVEPEVVDEAWRLAAELPGLRATDDAALQALGAILPAATWPVAVFHALGIALCFLLARRLFGRGVGLVFAILLAFEPFLLSLSRVLHVDALQTTAGAIALLAAGVRAAGGAKRYAALAGIACALAALAKVPGLYVVPWALLLVAIGPDRRGAPTRERLLGLAVWGVAFGLTGLVLWPALAVDPVGTIEAVRSGGLRYAERAIDTSKIFLGARVEAPDARFYPVAFAYRASPVLVVGLLLSPFVWWRGRPRERFAWVLALAIALGYVLVLSTSPKMFDRYLLPTFPAWALMAAFGYSVLGRLITGVLDRRRGTIGWHRFVAPALLGGLFAVHAAQSLPSHPYYLAWYSPLAGGLRSALVDLPVGWGEGLDPIAAWAGAQAELDGRAPVLLAAGVAGLAPLVEGRVLDATAANLPAADYVVRYVSDTQVPVPDWLSDTLEAAPGPLFEVRVRSVPYAWVHRNPVGEALRAAVAADPAPVLSEDAPASDFGTGDARALPPEADVVPAFLAALANEAPGTWLVRHEPEPGPALAAAVFRLATGAHLVERAEAGPGRLERYAFVDDGGFDPASDVSRDALAGVRFGDELVLDGVAHTPYTASATRAVGLRTAWRWLGKDADDREELTAFAHLTDARGQLWGQADAHVPRGVDAPVLEIPMYPWPGTPPGPYRLWLGVYRSADGTRLAPDTEADEARLLVAEVQVGRPARVPSAEELGIVDALDVDAGALRLLGARLPEDPREGGREAPIELFWEVRSAEPISATVGFAIGDEADVVQVERLLGCAPDCVVEPGDRLRTRHRPRVPGRSAAGTQPVVVALGGTGATTTTVGLGTIEVESRARSYDPPDGLEASGAHFGDVAELAGSRSTRREDGVLTLTLAWRALEPTDVAYTVFAHALDAEGRVVAQHDAPPGGGAAPTNGWLPGEIVVDTIELGPAEAVAGATMVALGLYDPVTGARLPVVAAGGMAPSSDVLRLPVP